MLLVPSRLARGFAGFAGLGDNGVDLSTLPVTTDPSLPIDTSQIPIDTGGGAPSSGGGWTPGQIAAVIGAAGTAAGSAILATQAPRGYVYNAATGQYQPANTLMGIPGMATTTVGIGGSILPVVLGVAALAALVLVLKK